MTRNGGRSGQHWMSAWSDLARRSLGIGGSHWSTASCRRWQIVGALLVGAGPRPEPGIQGLLERSKGCNVGNDLARQHSGDCSGSDARLGGKTTKGPIGQGETKSAGHLFRDLSVLGSVRTELAIRPGLVRRQPGRGLPGLTPAHICSSSADAQPSEHTVTVVVSLRTAAQLELQVCYSFHLRNTNVRLLVDSEVRVHGESGWAARFIGVVIACTLWTST